MKEEQNKNHEICFTTFVFGENYYNYIPFLIYSLKYAYPNYVPVIYCHKELNENILKQLDALKELGEFHIIQNYLSNYSLGKLKGSAIRFFLFDEFFTDCKYLYYMDIDIFFIRETPSLLNQHIHHLKRIGLSYSNILRESNINLDRSELMFRLKKMDYKFLIQNLINKKFALNRMTGLHFIDTNSYFAKVKPLLQKYLNYCLDQSLSFKHHPGGFNDECLLYDLIYDAELGFPEFADYGPQLLDYRRFDNVGFRPHHGIHLGIFRDVKTINLYKNVLNKDFYIYYYLEYQKIKKNEIFKYLFKNSNEFIITHFQNMEDYYNNNI